jgi:hypothetical protein
MMVRIVVTGVQKPTRTTVLKGELEEFRVLQQGAAHGFLGLG